jgi:heavy metal sensor kinase
VRVTLAFTLVMAILLAGLGLFLYVRLGTTLDSTIDHGLRTRADDVATLVREADSGLSEAGRSPLTERGESVAQILDARGRVVDAPPGLRTRSLLTADQRRRALHGTVVVTGVGGTAEPERFRLLATPIVAHGRRVIVVVGALSEARDEAQARLGGMLLIGGPIALLLASLAGYGAAAGALRPVERMRRRARDIQAHRPGRRLPVPPAHDEIGRLGETLNEMLDRLEGAIERERRFVADAGHELRTPLTILRGELELALRDAGDVETFRMSVAAAVEETDRLTRLAEDLLITARADEGRLPVAPQELTVVDELTRIAAPYERRAAENGATLTVEAPGSLRVAADRARLDQAVGNLLDNALIHGGDGPIALVAEAGADGIVEIHVRDHGSGFPPEFLAGAFDRFTRADAARRGDGAGLGLAIVAAIAAAHGGRARAANRDGAGGADVWLELPATGRGPHARS